MQRQPIPRLTLQRLPLYVNYLKSLPSDTYHISATAIAESLGLHDVQVRKDLAHISSGGRPKVGYQTKRLISDIRQYLGHGGIDPVILVGMGHLGRALTHYHGFREYGKDIVAFFDNDRNVVGTTYAGREIYSIASLPEVCQRLGVQIGIITVPAQSAQEVCEALVGSGVQAIWNFAPTHLKVPEGVVVQNENMAVSLAILSNRARASTGPHLSEKGEMQP